MLAVQAGGLECGSVPTKKLGVLAHSRDSSIGREVGLGGKDRSQGLASQ